MSLSKNNLVVGQTVARIVPSRWNNPDTVMFCSIVKVTKTTVTVNRLSNPAEVYVHTINKWGDNFLERGNHSRFHPAPYLVNLETGKQHARYARAELCKQASINRRKDFIARLTDDIKSPAEFRKVLQELYSSEYLDEYVPQEGQQ